MDALFHLNIRFTRNLRPLTCANQFIQWRIWAEKGVFFCLCLPLLGDATARSNPALSGGLCGGAGRWPQCRDNAIQGVGVMGCRHEPRFEG